MTPAPAPRVRYALIVATVLMIAVPLLAMLAQLHAHPPT